MLMVQIRYPSEWIAMYLILVSFPHVVAWREQFTWDLRPLLKQRTAALKTAE